MKLSFFGAAREVTGSCFCVEAGGMKILVDCGMQQGQDEKDNRNLPFYAPDIDFVILTHSHIDHSGRLPLLVKRGFKGKIYAIEATGDLIKIMLEDSAQIQEADTRLENKKARRAGRKEVEPLYSMDDVEDTLKLVEPCYYGQTIELGEAARFNFVDAGHILGSASVELFLGGGDLNRKIVFSGDIGNLNQPIIRDPQYIGAADYVVMEATYGNRNHEIKTDYILEFARIVDETLSRGGNVIIPSFAVGRTQGLLYLLHEIKKRKLVPNTGFPVYVDSPLGSEATRIYNDDLRTYADSQTKEILKNGLNPLTFPGLTFTDSAEDSKALNYDTVPKVIISSSGMCDAGRIRHHLKHNLWKKECSVVFVGFQVQGTLGRMLLDGEKMVSIFREEIAVAATIHNFTGLSAHADKDGLIKWINEFDKKPDKVFVVHSEASVGDEFTDTLNASGFLAEAPLYRSVYDLNDGTLITSGIDPGQEGL